MKHDMVFVTNHETKPCDKFSLSTVSVTVNGRGEVGEVEGEGG